MDVLEKAKILGHAGHFDSCGPKICEVNVNSGLGGIYYAKAEHKTCRIFKTLMDNSCNFDCKYCENTVKKRKVRYEPEELVKVFNYLRDTMDVHGLFLSSGISGDADKATERMLEAVRLVRKSFKGYIHFKVLPGTSYELIIQASELADRMSINIEAPNKEVLSELSTCKDYKVDILKRQAWISKLKLSSGQTTQIILNRFSTDKDVLRMTEWEYNVFKLRRVYYSAFKPVQGTALENEKPESSIRQNRLYNVDFLMRDYGYKLKEFDAIMGNEMLPSEDPKMALAKATLEPIDINDASYEELIRVPGIGPKTARKVEKSKGIRKYEDLKKLGVLERAKPFIKIEGRRQARLREYS